MARTATPVRTLVAGTSALLVAASVAGQEPPLSSRRWSEAATEAVIVASDASAQETTALAKDLGSLRRTLLALAGAPADEAPLLTRIMAFAERGDFLRTLRREDGSEPDAALVSALDRRGRLIALAGIDRGLSAVRETIARDLLDQLFAAPPAWLRCGLEALFAGMEGEGGLLREAGTGSPPVASWPAADALSDACRADSPQAGGAAVALVRYLAQPRSDRSAQFRRYLTLLRGGWAEGLAFEESFGVPFALVYEEARRAAREARTPPLEIEVVRSAPPARARPLPHGHLLLALGDLLARAAPWNTVAAELHYRAAIENGASRAAALRGIAVLREHDGRIEDAWALFEDSLELAPRDPRTLMLYGWSRLERFRREVGTRHGWEEPPPRPVLMARSLFERAMLERREKAPHALHGFGATFLYSRGDLEPGLDALQQAHRLLPAWPEILADLTLLHAHAGDFERARRLYEHRLPARASAQLLAEIGRLLIEEELVAANSLLQAGKLDEAGELLRRAMAAASEPEARGEIDEALRRLAELEAAHERDVLRERFNRAYEAALQRIQEGDVEAARRLLAPFAADPTDPEVQATARDLLRQLEARAASPDR